MEGSDLNVPVDFLPFTDNDRGAAFIIYDTNAQYLCQELATVGIDVFWISQVGDNQGRVRGIQGLRVVDASIFPVVPCANTNFPVLMTAEKIADAMQ